MKVCKHLPSLSDLLHTRIPNYLIYIHILKLTSVTSHREHRHPRPRLHTVWTASGLPFQLFDCHYWAHTATINTVLFYIINIYTYTTLEQSANVGGCPADPHYNFKMSSWKAELARSKGNEHFRAGRYEEAIGSFSAAIKEYAQDYISYTNRCASFMKLKRWEDAIHDASMCISLQPQ